METIFTKIAKKEIPAFIIHENDKYIAFLDIKPSVYGQTLVVPKEWQDPYIFQNDDQVIADLMAYAKQIAKLLDSKLGSERCLVMFEGYGVNHLHCKLYPVKSAEEALEFSPRNKIEFNDEIGNEILQKVNS